MKSIHEFLKKRIPVLWRLIPLLERIRNEPIDDEIDVDLKKYVIKDLELFKKQLESIKEQYLESDSL